MSDKAKRLQVGISDQHRALVEAHLQRRRATGFPITLTVALGEIVVAGAKVLEAEAKKVKA